MSSAIFNNLTRLTGSRTRTKTWKEFFTYDEVGKDLIGGVHVATLSENTWLFTEMEGYVFTVHESLPKLSLKDLRKSKEKWFVKSGDDTWFELPDDVVTQISIDNETTNVVLFPTIFEVAFRTTKTKLIGFFGKVKSGAKVIINVDPRKFRDKVEFEPILVSSLIYGLKDFEMPTAPAYSPNYPVNEGMKLKDMDYGQLKQEWFKNNGGLIFEELTEHDLTDEASWFCELWQAIVNKRKELQIDPITPLKPVDEPKEAPNEKKVHEKETENLPPLLSFNKDQLYSQAIKGEEQEIFIDLWGKKFVGEEAKKKKIFFEKPKTEDSLQKRVKEEYKDTPMDYIWRTFQGGN